MFKVDINDMYANFTVTKLTLKKDISDDAYTNESC